MTYFISFYSSSDGFNAINEFNDSFLKQENIHFAPCFIPRQLSEECSGIGISVTASADSFESMINLLKSKKIIVKHLWEVKNNLYSLIS